jgi:hypothetical protein
MCLLHLFPSWLKFKTIWTSSFKLWTCEMKLLLWNEHLKWKWMVQHVHNLGCLYPNLTCVLTPLKIEASKCRIIQLSMRIYRWIKLSFVIKLFWIIIPTSIHVPISSFTSIIRKSTIPYYSCNRFIDFLHVCNAHNKSILYAHTIYIKFILEWIQL